jgi:ribosomal protein L18
MTWLAALKLILQVAGFIARRAERLDIEKAVLNELGVLHGKRVDAAVDARDDVLAGRVPVDLADKYRRD